jgi:UDP-N-acetylmuramate--alanine ligase
MSDEATRDFPQPVHFIGIGGAGMSGIAMVLAELGVDVRGSDLKASRYTRHLVDAGVPVAVGHDAANLGDAALVVTSSAIPDGNPELRAARAAELPVLRRAEMLARVMAMRRGIAVAGTHGKTTTSSMISHVLRQAGLNPTFLVGGELNDIGSNAGVGQGEWLVAEAD